MTAATWGWTQERLCRRTTGHEGMLHELQRLWLLEAARYNILPLDDRRVERFSSDLAGRPVLIKGNFARQKKRASLPLARFSETRFPIATRQGRPLTRPI